MPTVPANAIHTDASGQTTALAPPQDGLVADSTGLCRNGHHVGNGQGALQVDQLGFLARIRIALQ